MLLFLRQGVKRMLKMLAKGEGRFFVPLALKQIQNIQMLLAVHGIMFAVLLGAIGEQPAHPVHALDSIDRNALPDASTNDSGNRTPRSCS